MKNKRIIAVHLLNDFSGSPFVLRQALEALVANGTSVELFTSTPQGQGFLSNLDGIKEHTIFYKWHHNKLITLCYFILGQLSIFFKLIAYLRKTDVVYINSLLPFGAGLAAKLKGCRVVYHFHEVSIKPTALKNILLFFANYTANAGIFVSEYLMKNTAFSKQKFLIYNALPQNFVNVAVNSIPKKDEGFTVLMACSLKKYKGVEQFIESAKKLANYNFILVLNTSEADKNEYIYSHNLPENINVYAAQKNMHPFYTKADLVVNLSLPGEWVETFGMTILEAMYYRKPVIIPPVGGITELATDGIEGYRIDANNIEELATIINTIAANKTLYNKLSENAFKKATQFTPAAFSNSIVNTYNLIFNQPIA